MKVRSPSPVKNISTVDPHRACASFVFTSQRIHPLRSMAKCKKPEFRSLLAELGHFLTSDVILKENFCRLASIWLIGLMKLFALGRTDLAAARKFRLVGKAENFTEKVVILLRILSSVGDGVTPSGPPSALTSSVVAKLDTWPALSRAFCFVFFCCQCWWCCHSHFSTHTWLALLLVNRAKNNLFPFLSIYIHADNVR